MIILTLFGRTGRSFTGQSAGGIFLLLILTVPARVRTQCSACTSPSIKTVNVTTGECISCFPCLQCHEGHTSTVPCGSTVPFGTDIKCVLIQSDPVVASYTSTQKRHLTTSLLTISPSAKLIDTPVTSVTRPSVISSPSSTAPVGSSIKYGYKTTEKPKSTDIPDSGDYAEWKKNVLTYVLCAACLLITFIAIIWKISKLKNKQLQQRLVLTDRPTTSGVQPQPNASPSQGNVNPAARTSTPLAQPRSYISHSETCNINWPTNSVAFSRSSHSGISKVGDSVQRFQPEGNIMSSTLVTTTGNHDSQDNSTIASVAGTVVHSDNLDSPTADLQNEITPSANMSTSVNVFLTLNDPSQIQRGTGALPPFAELASTSCHNNLVIPATSAGMLVALNQGTTCDLSSVAAPASQPWPIEGNRGYSTHITHVPFPVIHKMCMMLDLERTIDGNDHRMLGNELGLNPLQISSLKQKSQSPSNVLLMQKFSAMPNSGTLEHLIPILTKMGRHDVIQVIDEWVGSQNCTQVAQVN